jgi:flagellar FliL protein
MIRDAVISVLTTKKAADITPKNMDSIKLQLIQKINPLLTNGQLNNIYINDILVQ